MAKLNQIIAIEKGIKSRVYSEVGELHKALKKGELFNGLVKEYKAKNDEDEVLPSERKRVTYTVDGILQTLERLTVELFDVTARKDWTNQTAFSDVIVDGKVLLPLAPVSYLLFLEKQLTDLRTIADGIPLLDEAEDWKRDENSSLFKTEPTATHRTRKIAKPIVLYPATPEHPAQTQMVTEDVIAGYWHTTKHSGAWPKPKRAALIERIDKLLRAAKEAREAANNLAEAPSPPVGALVFGYLMGD